MMKGVFRINPYKARYRQLLASGANAWVGDGFAGVKIQQEKTLHWLNAHGYLPVPGASILELGCGSDITATQYLAERDYAISGVDMSETAIRWAEDRFQQAGLGATFLAGNVCYLSQCKDVQFALAIDGSCLHCLLGDERRHSLAEAKRLLGPVDRLVIGSMCGLPRYAEDLATYDPIKHHLLKEGQPWHIFKPLPALPNEIQQTQFSVLATGARHNARWGHTIIVCPTNGSLADPQKS